jgi:hypothetical protein
LPTALFVQRDTSYHLVRRRLRGTMTRDQWDNPQWRRAAIEATWQGAIAAVRDDNQEFVMPAPVTLFYAGNSLLCADIRLSPSAPPKYIRPDGRPMVLAPVLAMSTVHHTTYKQWAEGPLIHIEIMQPTTTLSADDQRAIDSLPNAALRERALAAVGVTGYSAEAQDAPDMNNLVDFRIRGIFKTKDYTVLESKQSSQGSKLLLGDGSVWDGRDDESAPDDILGD